LATRDTRTDDTDVANLRMTLAVDQTYRLSYWVYIPSQYAGDAVQMGAEWVGATGVGPPANLTIRDSWQRVVLSFTLGENSGGYLVLRLLGARTSDFVYIDDVKVQLVS
jgi:hypothetical protein